MNKNQHLIPQIQASADSLSTYATVKASLTQLPIFQSLPEQLQWEIAFSPQAKSITLRKNQSLTHYDSDHKILCFVVKGQINLENDLPKTSQSASLIKMVVFNGFKESSSNEEQDNFDDNKFRKRQKTMDILERSTVLNKSDNSIVIKSYQPMAAEQGTFRNEKQTSVSTIGPANQNQNNSYNIKPFPPRRKLSHKANNITYRSGQTAGLKKSSQYRIIAKIKSQILLVQSSSLARMEKLTEKWREQHFPLIGLNRNTCLINSKPGQFEDVYGGDGFNIERPLLQSLQSHTYTTKFRKSIVHSRTSGNQQQAVCMNRKFMNRIFKRNNNRNLNRLRTQF